MRLNYDCAARLRYVGRAGRATQRCQRNAVYKAEPSEKDGAVSRKQMEMLAKAMCSKFVCAIVPDDRVEDLKYQQARRKAAFLLKQEPEAHRWSPGDTDAWKVVIHAYSGVPNNAEVGRCHFHKTLGRGKVEHAGRHRHMEQLAANSLVSVGNPGAGGMSMCVVRWRRN